MGGTGWMLRVFLNKDVEEKRVKQKILLNG
jgi:hypothetical protein